MAFTSSAATASLSLNLSAHGLGPRFKLVMTVRVLCVLRVLCSAVLRTPGGGRRWDAVPRSVRAALRERVREGAVSDH